MPEADRGLFLGDNLLPTASRHARLGEPVVLPLSDLLTHVFVCGGTGLGKTVLGKAIVEGAALEGIPSLIVDLKGDLTSLAIPAQDVLAGVGAPPPLPELLGDAFGDHRKGFEQAALVEANYRKRCQQFADSVRVEVLTPRSDLVKPVALASFPTIGVPPEKCESLERQDYMELMRAFIEVFLSRVHGSAAGTGRLKNEASLLQALLEHAWAGGVSLEGEAGIERLVTWIVAPPIQRVGALPVDMAMGDRERTNLARSVNTQLVGLERDWHRGVPLDLDALLAARDGRTPIVILNASYLQGFADQAFVVAQVCYSIYRWMRKKGGASRPRLLFFLDEIGAGGGNQSFFPSAPYNPPSKAPLSIVLRQGRAFGVCCLLATQNVVGVDQRGLGNCGTWVIGNLNSETDRNRIDKALGEVAAGYVPMSARMAALRPREFLLRSRSGEVTTLRERWLYSVHETIASTNLPRLAKYLAGRALRPPPAPADQACAEGAAEGLPPAAAPAAGVADDGRPPPVGEEPPGAVRKTESFAPTIVVEPTETRPTASPAWRLRVPPQDTAFELRAGDTVTVGRHPSCDVVLTDPTVSRRHLVLDVMKSSVNLSVDPHVKNTTRVGGNVLGPGENALVAGAVDVHLGETTLRLEPAS